MDILTLLLIIILGLLLTGLLIGAFIFTYFRGRNSIRERTDEAVIFPLYGRHFGKLIKAELSETISNGFQYTIKNNEKPFFVHKKIATLFYNGKRFLFAIPDKTGKLFACNVNPETLELSEITNDEKETLLDEFVKANIGGGAVKAVQKHKKAGILIVIIIALLVGILGTIGFIEIQKQYTTQQQTQQNDVLKNQQIVPAK